MFAALGNLADLPGSAIRDVLAAKNPFDQLLDPFGQEGRTSGQELIARWGGGADHPFLGAGLEMLLDPSMLLGGALIRGGLKGSKLLKTLKAAPGAVKGAFQKAGQSDDFVRSLFGSAKQAAMDTGAFSRTRTATRPVYKHMPIPSSADASLANAELFSGPIGKESIESAMLGMFGKPGGFPGEWMRAVPSRKMIRGTPEVVAGKKIPGRVTRGWTSDVGPSTGLSWEKSLSGAVTQQTTIDPANFQMAVTNLKRNLPSRAEAWSMLKSKPVRNPILGAAMIDAAMSGRAENQLTPEEMAMFE